MKMLECYKESGEWLAPRIGVRPQVAVVLGSGLGEYVRALQGSVSIPYEDIPHFPRSHNQNHQGVLHAGQLGDKNVLLMSGRVHPYEGYSFGECSYYVPVLQMLGVETLIVTNAAGGINPNLSEGCLMLISDHIKLTSQSPVTGEETLLPGRPRFFDMGNSYSVRLRALAKENAGRLGIDVKEGVYAYMAGPQYETPAEIRMLSRMGADAVGMSTVPEVIMAAYCGMELLGISCITNMAAGMNAAPLSDEDVRYAAQRAGQEFAALLTGIIQSL